MSDYDKQDERQRLTPLQLAVTREGATEPAFSGDYVCCDSPLFDSATKYDSGSGWPSFTAPHDNRNVTTLLDTSHGMRRLEVRCANCDAHLGHVFDDGPGADGKRFCINSAALNFEGEEEASDE